MLMQVDLLSEINQQPMFQPPTGQQLPQAMATEVQEWVTNRRPANFLASLATRFLLPPADAVLTSQRYNIPLLNSFVFYVGLTVCRQQRKPLLMVLLVMSVPEPFLAASGTSACML